MSGPNDYLTIATYGAEYGHRFRVCGPLVDKLGVPARPVRHVVPELARVHAPFHLCIEEKIDRNVLSPVLRLVQVAKHHE